MGVCVIFPWSAVLALGLRSYVFLFKVKESIHQFLFYLVGFCLFVCFCLFRAAAVAYGGSQDRGQIGAVASGLHHSHSNSNARSELRL